MARSGAYVAAPGESERRWMGTTWTDFLATGALTGGRFALVDERAPRGVGAPLHKHPADEESFYVIEGEMTFFAGDLPPRRGEPGTFVHVPAGVVHGFRIDSEAARYLILTTVHHGEFYRAITLPSRDGSMDRETMDRACKEFGVEFVGPLPS